MDLIATLLLVLIGIVIGFLLNALVTSLRRKPDEQATKEVPKPAQIPEEAVRVWRAPGSQQLNVEIEGEVFRSAGDLNEAQREQLVRFTSDLGRWLGSSGATARAYEPPSQLGASQFPPSSSAHQPATLEPSQISSGEPASPNLNPFKIFTRVFQPGSKTPGESGPGSIVAQIDALLQSRLEGTHLATRGIRLVETPGQGIEVQVGLESYAAIEAVPDPEVQAAIRQAVADWEAGVEK